MKFNSEVEMYGKMEMKIIIVRRLYNFEDFFIFAEHLTDFQSG